jgi:hypothetical protein
MKQAFIKASVALAIVACMAVSAMASTVTIDGKQFAVCKDASKAGGPDAYARKWGWENNSSCVVPATVNATGCTYTVSRMLWADNDPHFIRLLSRVHHNV